MPLACDLAEELEQPQNQIDDKQKYTMTASSKARLRRALKSQKGCDLEQLTQKLADDLEIDLRDSE